MPRLRIGGLVPFTTTDYPGHLAAVVFCQGCTWRCAYCHNPHLLPAHGPEHHAWVDVRAFLEKRRGLLDAVVFSGGEPTLQGGLADAMREVKAMGFKVGLHSAGMVPDRLSRVLPLVDWVGLDVKAPRQAYPRITGVAGSGEAAFESLTRVLAAGVAYELRCTWHPDLLSDADLAQLGLDLEALGVRCLVLQACRSEGCAQPLRELSPAHWETPGVYALSQRLEHFSRRRAEVRCQVSGVRFQVSDLTPDP
jgi:pyruvate formate lyase activating enzyme